MSSDRERSYLSYKELVFEEMTVFSLRKKHLSGDQSKEEGTREIWEKQTEEQTRSPKAGMNLV